MIKHVGNHNQKKVVIVYKQVPGEDHMCLVAYSDLMARVYHDSVMATLESASGQEAKELADALFRAVLPDGRNTLHVMHQEGLLKKVPTNQVSVTPTPRSSIRLDELNDLLAKMAQGDEAIEKLAKMDAERGITGKKRQLPPSNQAPQQSQVPANTNQGSTTSANINAPEPGYIDTTISPASNLQDINDLIGKNITHNVLLTNAEISADLLRQSATLRNNAEALIMEADRLKLEADNLATEAKTLIVKKPKASKKKSIDPITTVITTPKKQKTTKA